MMKTGMLIVTNPNKYIKFLPRLQTEIENTLYIHFHSKKPNLLLNNNVTSNNKSLRYGPNFSSTMLKLYNSSVCIRQVDVRVLLQGPIKAASKITTIQPVEVVYFDDGICPKEAETFVDNCVTNKSLNLQTIPLVDEDPEHQHNLDDAVQDFEAYDYVVLGGTFDRLHIGHKILLSEAALRCRKKLVVGVTNTEMLKTKKLWELIEPCETRICNVKEFLNDVQPNLEVNIVPIGDMFGPTKDDPTFQMLIVSKETVKGGNTVNEVRLKNGLQPLVIHSVDLIYDHKCDDVEEDKVSSSNDRLRLLGTRLKKPRNNPKRPQFPYIIGLTGGIASGKTSISEKLQCLGAGVVNCDTVAHQLYEIGQPTYKRLLSTFGEVILSENGNINRKHLGSIVFNDKVKLATLNSILWPSILEESEKIIKRLYEEEHKCIVILDAALLIQAGWFEYCHEVWTCIIPVEEAVKRLKVRNGLTEEQSMARINTQLNNTEQVKEAHVIFSTLWSYEYTQKQVEKAWVELQERLSFYSNS